MSLAAGYRIQCQTRVQDKICSFSVAYLCSSGTFPSTDSRDLNDGWATTVEPVILDLLASDVTYEGTYTTALLPGVAMPNRHEGVSLPGLRSGNALPANSCAVISLQTTDITAIRQGRIYISGISKTDVTSGLFTASFVNTELDALRDAILGGISQGGKDFVPVIVQRVINGAPIAGNMLLIDSAKISNIPYTQRRRTTRQLGFAPAA